MVILLMCQNQL